MVVDVCECGHTMKYHDKGAECFMLLIDNSLKSRNPTSCECMAYAPKQPLRTKKKRGEGVSLGDRK